VATTMTIDIHETRSAASADAMPVVLSAATNTTTPASRGGLPASVPADELVFWTEVWRTGDEETRRRLARGEGRIYRTAQDVIRELLKND